MRTRTKRKIRFVLQTAAISSVAGAIGGTIAGLVATQFDIFMPVKAVVTAMLMGLVMPATDLFFLTGVLRKYPFAIMVGLKASVLSLVSILTYVVISYGMRSWVPWSFQIQEILAVSVLNLFICSIYSVVVGLNRLLGRRVLGSFITGRYFHPIEEQRIFMFLDLASSTTIAEKIGHTQFHRLLHEFFYDMTEAIIDSNGEIYKYVGDEVIVVWKLAEGIRNASCLRCYFSICDAIVEEREKYEQRFGLVPEFTVGMHCGTVIAGEMGDDRVEIAYLGDVVNTTARVQAECKARGERLLLSQALCEKLTLPAPMKARAVGQVKLRGKEQVTGLFTIDREGKEEAKG